MINEKRAPTERATPQLRNFLVRNCEKLVQSITMTKLCTSLPRHDDREEKAERRAEGRAPSQRHEACCWVESWECAEPSGARL